MHTLKLIALGLLTAPLSWDAPESYKIDDSRSFANWSIRHIVGKTTGSFTGIKGTLMLDPTNPSIGNADVTISLYSLESGHRERDAHLLSSDFLDAVKHPNMRFVSQGVRPTGKDTGVMTGQLSLHGVTRTVDIPYRILGFSPDPWGNQRAGFEGRFSLNRSDYGITKYLNASDDGLIGNEVNITLLVEGLKLGPDGQVLNIKPRSTTLPGPMPQSGQPTAPTKREKPSLEDILREMIR
jgi:polyisoprenoid-binding protein YceI